MSSSNRIWLFATGAIALIAAIYSVGRRNSKSRRLRKPADGGLAWALLFLSSGRMPPPPPQSQIEQDEHERKDRSINANDEP